MQVFRLLLISIKQLPFLMLCGNKEKTGKKKIIFSVSFPGFGLCQDFSRLSKNEELPIENGSLHLNRVGS